MRLILFLAVLLGEFDHGMIVRRMRVIICKWDELNFGEQGWGGFPGAWRAPASSCGTKGGEGEWAAVPPISRVSRSSSFDALRLLRMTEMDGAPGIPVRCDRHHRSATIAGPILRHLLRRSARE